MKKKTSPTKLKKSKNKKQLTSAEANSIIPPSLVEPKKPRGKEKVHYVNSKEFDRRLNELALVVELLEKTEKTLSSASFDLKNLIDIIKLETT